MASYGGYEKEREEFENEVEIFSKTAKAIDELLETTMEEREKWLELQDDFEKFIKIAETFPTFRKLKKNSSAKQKEV